MHFCERKLLAGVLALLSALNCGADSTNKVRLLPRPRIAWVLDKDRVSLHKVDLDHDLNSIVGRLPKTADSAPSTWSVLAETHDLKLYLLAATPRCTLYCLDTHSLVPDRAQMLPVSLIARLPVKIHLEKDEVGLTVGPDGNLYLSLLCPDRKPANDPSGLWRIVFHGREIELHFVGRFAGYIPGRTNYGANKVARNALGGGIAYDATKESFVGFGYNEEGRRRLYRLPQKLVLRGTNALFTTHFWKANNVEQLSSIAIDNCGYSHWRKGDVYVSKTSGTIFKFPSIDDLNSEPHNSVAEMFQAPALTLEPYDPSAISHKPQLSANQPIGNRSSRDYNLVAPKAQ